MRTSFPLRVALLGLAMVFAFVFAAVCDVAFFGRMPLQEGAPYYDLFFALRTLGAFALALFFILTLYVSREKTSAFDAGWHWGSSGNWMAYVSGCALVVALLAAALMIFDPEQFKKLSVEDSLVEWLSAALLFSGGFCFLAAAIALFAQRNRRSGALIMLVCGFVLLAAMEEVSWFQRVLGFSTPEAMSAINAQEEFNLHNVSTNKAENIYYFGAFLFLVALPFVAAAASQKLKEKFDCVPVPSHFLVIVGALTTAFGWEMWNIFWFQFAAFASLLALVVYAANAIQAGRKQEAVLFAGAAAVFIAVHILGFAAGPAMVRSWDDTEYKELFIALGLAAAGVETLAQSLGRHADWDERPRRQTGPSPEGAAQLEV